MVDVIDHEGHVADGEGGGDDSNDDIRGGNFPEPAIPVCGDLPEGIDPVEDLASAWVVSGERPYVSSEVPDLPDVPRLRIGSIGFAADEPTNWGWDDDEECGPPGWALAFDLPEPLVPGVLQLAELQGGYFDTYVGFDDGCGAGAGPLAAEATPAITGELRILAVTDDCVVGEFIDAHNSFFAADAPGTGGFVAQRATLPCVPLDVDCE